MAIELRGKIKDEYGNPLNNVTVEAYEEGIGTPAASTVTNSDGIWSFAGLDETKTWCIIASASGLQKREIYGGSKVQVAELAVTDRMVLPDGSVLDPANGAGEKWLLAVSNTAPDGSAQAFNIGTGVASAKVQVFVNGLLRTPNVDYSFTPGGTTVVFNKGWVPVAGDEVKMLYVEA